MKERPIIFNGDMVRAILDGRKTQERRPIKPQPIWVGDPSVPFRTKDADPKGIIRCPYGAPGDRLWVRETWRMDAVNIGAEYRATISALMEHVAPWTPSIHMPRWASRITLEITAVRVQRVQDITEEDALAEGMVPLDRSTPREMFAEVWQSIYGNWPANPWVWVVEFRRIEP